MKNQNCSPTTLNQFIYLNVVFGGDGTLTGGGPGGAGGVGSGTSSVGGGPGGTGLVPGAAASGGVGTGVPKPGKSKQQP